VLPMISEEVFMDIIAMHRSELWHGKALCRRYQRTEDSVGLYPFRDGAGAPSPGWLGWFL